MLLIIQHYVYFIYFSTNQIRKNRFFSHAKVFIYYYINHDDYDFDVFEMSYIYIFYVIYFKLL